MLHLNCREHTVGRASNNVADPFFAERERDVRLGVFAIDADITVLENDVAPELQVVEDLFLNIGFFHSPCVLDFFIAQHVRC